MSDAARTATAILLPAASVSLFVQDHDIEQAASTLTHDWRFARVQMTAQKGTVDDAIAHYQQSPSPNLVIIQTETLDTAFTDKLETLGNVCGEHTAAVVIGPVNDVYLYRKLIDMGVSDYLVRPVGGDILADVIAKTLIEKLGTSDSRLIAFLGAKGGVGTSTLAQVTAFAVAERLNQKTIILDAAGGWSYLSVDMGTEPMTTMHETARAVQSTDQDSFKRMIYAPTEKLSVLATGGDPMLEDSINPEIFEAILNRLLISHPVMIVDLSGASAAIRKMTLTRAHELVLVATPTLPSLRAARALLQDVRELRGGVQHEVELVINMTGQATGAEVAAKDIEAALERKISLSVPYDPKIFMTAQIQGKKVVDMKGSEKIINDLLGLANRVIRAQEPVAKKQDKGFLGELMGALKTK